MFTRRSLRRLLLAGGLFFMGYSFLPQQASAQCFWCKWYFLSCSNPNCDNETCFCGCC
jgi:hypothetical protein